MCTKEDSDVNRSMDDVSTFVPDPEAIVGEGGRDGLPHNKHEIVMFARKAPRVLVNEEVEYRMIDIMSPEQLIVKRLAGELGLVVGVWVQFEVFNPRTNHTRRDAVKHVYTPALNESVRPSPDKRFLEGIGPLSRAVYGERFVKAHIDDHGKIMAILLLEEGARDLKLSTSFTLKGDTARKGAEKS